MWTRILKIISIIAVVISFGAGFAHLLEAYNKMQLNKNDYQVVQQIYRGWALLGAVIFIGLIATLLLTIRTRKQPEFKWNLLSCAGILLSLIVFLIFTFPVNQQTHNWQLLPDNWQQLRTRWEYSHITNAVIYFATLMMLVLPELPQQLRKR